MKLVELPYAVLSVHLRNCGELTMVKAGIDMVWSSVVKCLPSMPEPLGSMPHNKRRGGRGGETDIDMQTYIQTHACIHTVNTTVNKLEQACYTLCNE